MTLEEYKKLKKQKKYRNIKVEVDEIVFDSKKEAKRYGDLQFLLKHGKIQSLEVHPVYTIEVMGIIICKCIPDFRYVENGHLIVEDVKSKPTMTPVYRIKKKLLLACYGLEIREVF